MQKKKAAKITGCIDTLNQVLPEKEKLYIKDKKIEYYETMAKHFQKGLEKYASQNSSFQLFIEDMKNKTL